MLIISSFSAIISINLELLFLTVGNMTKIRQFVPLQILKQIYFVFIHSHLTYGIIVWGAILSFIPNSAKIFAK